MKKAYVFLTVAAMSLYAAAANPSKPAVIGQKTPLLSLTEGSSQHMTFSSCAQAASETTETKYTVTINFGLDGEDIEPAIISFYDEAGNVYGTRPGAMSASINLPAGKYDAVCLFECNTTKSRFPYQSTIWVVNEGISVNGDTEVTFDAAKVKAPIKVKLVHADGSDVTIDVTQKNASGGYDVVTPGNTRVVLHRMVLVADGTKGYMSGGGSFSDHVIPGDFSKTEFDPEPVFDIWINPLSERFTMGVMRMLINDDCVEIIGAPVFKIDPSTVATNDMANFVSTKADFIHTPAYDKRTQDYDYPYQITARLGINYDYPYLLSANIATEIGHNVKICADEKSDPFIYGVQFGIMDRIDVQTIKEEIIPGFFYETVVDNSKPITSPWAFLDNGVFRYALDYYDYDLSEGPDYPGAPAHCFESKNSLVAFGEGVPFTQHFFTVSENDGVIRPELSTFSVGMSGERRESDDADILMSIKVDGQESLNETVNTISKWSRQFDFAKSTPSEIEIRTWHENSKVDDINGFSSMKTNIRFTDGIDGDFFPPVIASIRTLAPGNIISQSFSKADHGTVSIYAGDINTVFSKDNDGESTRSFVYSDLADLKIEYALHGNDNFKNLNVNTQGEPDQLYGQLYSASLADVDGENNSWYDLRVTASDTNGNTQQQLISPAFFILSTSGITSAKPDASETYKVIGRTIVSNAENFAVYNLSGIKMNPYSLAAGVYVVHTGEKVDKVVIK